MVGGNSEAYWWELIFIWWEHIVGKEKIIEVEVQKSLGLWPNDSVMAHIFETRSLHHLLLPLVNMFISTCMKYGEFI